MKPESAGAQSAGPNQDGSMRRAGGPVAAALRNGDGLWNVFCRLRAGVVLALLLLAAWPASAKEIQVKTIALTIDDSLTVVESERYALIAGNDRLTIALAALDQKNFSVKKIFASMDTLYFNLAGAELIKRKRDHPFQWTRDYVTKYYKTSDGRKVITHTFYTNGTAFCLFARYNAVEEEEAIRSTIRSIWFNDRQSLPYRLFTVYSYATLFWIALAVLISLAGIALKEGKANFFSSLLTVLIIAGLIVLLTADGHWEIVGGASVVYGLIFTLAYWIGLHISFGDD